MIPKKIMKEFKSKGGYSNEMCEFLKKSFERENVNRATVEKLLRDGGLKDVDLKTDVFSMESGNNN